jgi:hypothetical protein
MSQGYVTLRGRMWDQLMGEADAAGVEVIVCDLPAAARPGIYCRHRGSDYILVQRGLDEPLRTAVLAHELEHFRRGGGADADGMSDYWWPCVAREEARVRAAAARRRIDLEDLAELAEAAEAFGHHVTAADVAGDYQLTHEEAEHVMRVYLEERRRDTA